MKKYIKKSASILVVLTFILSAVGLSQAVAVNRHTSDVKEDVKTETITFYRFGPDGSVTPVNIVVEYEKEQDLGKILEDKCNELFENDLDMQATILKFQNNNTTANRSFNYGFLRVKSHGRGFHFKTKPDIKITIKFKWLKLMIPRIFICKQIQWIFCSYKKDPKAVTTVRPIVRSMFNENATKTFEGNHTVLVKNFVGYTTWIGRFSKSFIIPRAFSGFARLVICKKLP
jgi:hypothetical protein